MTEVLYEVEKSLDKKLYCKLEDLITEFEDVLVDKWFNYGSVAREVSSCWPLGDDEKNA